MQIILNDNSRVGQVYKMNISMVGLSFKISSKVCCSNVQHFYDVFSRFSHKWWLDINNIKQIIRNLSCKVFRTILCSELYNLKKCE